MHKTFEGRTGDCFVTLHLLLIKMYWLPTRCQLLDKEIRRIKMRLSFNKLSLKEVVKDRQKTDTEKPIRRVFSLCGGPLSSQSKSKHRRVYGIMLQDSPIPDFTN